jgi:hypothetical protein
VGTSSNDVYLTLHNPSVSPVYHTVVHLGSHNAAGQGTDAGTVAGLWVPFDGLNVRRVADNAILGYWRGGSATAMFTADLLQDTNGQCGAWAELLKDVLAAQGISASKVGVVEASHPMSYLLLVKTWTFTGSGVSPGTAPYVYVEGEDLTDELGVPGQDNGNPPGAFYNHFIVQYAGQYYDPSYGTGPFASQNAWENASLDGFGYVGSWGGDDRVFAKTNDPSVVETSFI